MRLLYSLFTVVTIVNAFARPRDSPDELPYDDKEAVADIMSNEIQNAGGLSDQQYSNFQSGLSALNFIAQNYFTGEVNPDVERPTLLETVMDGQELTPISPFLYQGDIILTPEQLGEVLAEAQEVARFQGVDPQYFGQGRESGEEVGSSEKRELQEEPVRVQSNSDPDVLFKSAVPGRFSGVLTGSSHLRWTMPIRYTINSGTGVDSASVRRGIQLWESLTCVRFQEGAPSGNYLEFFKGNGCFSNVGMIGGRQTVSIGNGCTLIGIVAHEIGHALGFWHEQSRPDANQHVRINSQSVQSGLLSNFLPKPASSVNLLGYPYDLGSVMHYGPTAFANSFGQITIATIDPNYANTIGFRQGVSFYDVKNINTAYCARQCANSQTKCQHNGYPNPNNCNTCMCPDGFGGSRCEKAASTSTNCGSLDLTATGSWQTLTRSGGGECNYVITAPAGRKVLLELTSFSFWAAETCDRNYVEIKYTDDIANTGARVCKGRPFSVKSKTTEAAVLYRGTFGNKFNLRFRMDPSTPLPPGVVTTPPPIIGSSTPSIPSTTSPNLVGWSPWTPWSGCTASCGGCGTQLRVRRCFSNDADCPGSWREDRECNFNACPGAQACCGALENQNGKCVKEVTPAGWTAWAEWSSCTASCGACGVMTRRRTCPSDDCIGAGLEAQRCAFQTCPNGVCCTTFFDDNGTCKFGEKPPTPAPTTTPEPSTPEPSTPEPSTPEPSTPEPSTPEPSSPEPTTPEPVTEPPVPEGWTSWSEWTECLGKSCGACGQRFRVRHCEAKSCSGETFERDVCGLQACSNCGGDLVARVVCPDDNTKFCPLLVGSKPNCPCCAPYRIGSDKQCYPVGPNDPEWYVHPRKLRK